MDRARFTALWERCLSDGGGERADASTAYEVIATHYSEPHRFYHTPEHIEHCLRQYDLASSLMHRPDVVEMAIWFHDVIYDVATVHHQQRSADLFMTLAGDSMDLGFDQSVYDMILATQHRVAPKNGDDKFLVDVDLSSFGLSWEEMRRDSENVRREFADFSDGDFYASHTRFMQALLHRPEFFVTEFFRERYESQAHSNIGRLLDEIKQAGFG